METFTQEVLHANRESWRDAWDIDGTVAYIRDNGFTRITLQFPDELLEESTLVTSAIAQECASQEVPAKVKRNTCFIRLVLLLLLKGPCSSLLSAPVSYVPSAHAVV